jgi:phosphoglycerol transferase
MQMMLILLFSLPVFLAHNYSLDSSSITTISALVSVSLLVYCVCALLINLKPGSIRNTLGLATFSILAIYFYAQFLSYYLQGSYFNQQFFFHLNFTALIETWSVYYPLVLLFIGWIICIGLVFLYFRNRVLRSKYSNELLALLLVSALVLDPGIRDAGRVKIRSMTSPGIESLQQIDWQQSGLDRNALENFYEATGVGKNLVLVFLEGLETVYMEESIFPGLTPNLNTLNAQGWQLNNLNQIESTGWTMGGIVATLCGTPLVYESSLGGNSIMFTRFLDKATCLPDILRQADYQQVFMGGASLEFAGKGDFLKQHGFDQVLGRAALRRQLPDASYLGAWGLFDDSLFALALQQYRRLAAEGKPFNLTLLTVDTHHPGGEPSSSCSPYAEIDNSILHAVHCTDYLVGNFIEQLKQHPAYEDTVVVMLSDHLALRNNAFSLFPKDYERHLYFNVLNSDHQASSQVLATPMDLAPTILEMLDITHDASFLVGIDLLDADVQRSDRNIDDPRWENIIRYINSNYLTTTENEVLYSLNRANWDEIDFVNDVENVEFSQNGVKFTATGNDPYFILPELRSFQQKDFRIYITIDVEQASAMALYYLTDEDKGYSETNKLTRETQAGTNQLVFSLNRRAGQGRLRIDPGLNPGKYFIRSLEIRS